MQTMLNSVQSLQDGMAYEVIMRARPRSLHRDGPAAGATFTTYNIGAQSSAHARYVTYMLNRLIVLPDADRAYSVCTAVLKRIVWGLPSDVWPVALCSVGIVVVRTLKMLRRMCARVHVAAARACTPC